MRGLAPIAREQRPSNERRSPPMPQWTVYSRADCSLCERLLEELAGLLGPGGRGRHVRVVDIAGDPELEHLSRHAYSGA